MDFFTNPLFISVKHILTEAAQIDLTQNLIVFGFMWHIIKKTIAGHFKKIEDGLNRIAQSLEDHSDRIESLEQSIDKILSSDLSEDE